MARLRADRPAISRRESSGGPPPELIGSWRAWYRPAEQAPDGLEVEQAFAWRAARAARRQSQARQTWAREHGWTSWQAYHHRR